MHTIAQAQTRMFKWGKHDCCMFANACVASMTGVNLAKQFNGYRSKEGAEKKLDGSTLEQIMDDFDLEKVEARLARRGDVMLVQVVEGPALGICTGTHATFAAPRGTVEVPLSSCEKAWRI